MKPLLLAAVLIAQPASALEVTYMDQDCRLRVSVQSGIFMVVDGSGKEVLCESDFWPTPNPVAQLKCDNGRTVIIDIRGADDEIDFDNVKMYRAGSPKLTCR